MPGASTRCLALLPGELDEPTQGYASIATLGRGERQANPVVEVGEVIEPDGGNDSQTGLAFGTVIEFSSAVAKRR